MQSIARKLFRTINIDYQFNLNTTLKDRFKYQYQNIILSVLGVFFIIQLLFPFRYVLYPGELFWHEQGYRFSWRVMLTEKTGWTSFKIVNSSDSTYFYIDNSDFLTPFQEKQMSFQPDFILEYAHYLGDHFSSKMNTEVQVYVDSRVTLNGRKSQEFIDNSIDLYMQNESFKNKKWILPFNDEIAGF